MNPARARELLGLLAAETSVRSIRAAFARRCRECHPDTARFDVPQDRVTAVGVLQQARDVLLEVAASANRACKLCGGRGRVRGALGVRSCSACAGTGDRR
jgi:hypothetical protein